MAGPLNDKHVLLGVTGSIACYKGIDLASKLVQAGALVDTIMTYGATRFVTCAMPVPVRPAGTSEMHLHPRPVYCR